MRKKLPKINDELTKTVANPTDDSSANPAPIVQPPARTPPVRIIEAPTKYRTVCVLASKVKTLNSFASSDAMIEPQTVPPTKQGQNLLVSGLML